MVERLERLATVGFLYKLHATLWRNHRKVAWHFIIIIQLFMRNISSSVLDLIDPCRGRTRKEEKYFFNMEEIY